MNPLIRRAVALGAAVTLSGVLVACSATSANIATGVDGHGMSTGMQSSSVAASRAGDVMFAQMMIPHHEQAVEMAEIALAKTDITTEIRSLATAIKQAQDPEIQTMTRWLQLWGAAAPTGSMDHGDMGSGMMSEADMNALAEAVIKAQTEEIGTMRSMS